MVGDVVNWTSPGDKLLLRNIPHAGSVYELLHALIGLVEHVVTPEPLLQVGRNLDSLLEVNVIVLGVNPHVLRHQQWLGVLLPG